MSKLFTDSKINPLVSAILTFEWAVWKGHNKNKGKTGLYTEEHLRRESARALSTAKERDVCKQVARFAPRCLLHNHVHKESGRTLITALN